MSLGRKSLLNYEPQQGNNPLLYGTLASEAAARATPHHELQQGVKFGKIDLRVESERPREGVFADTDLASRRM